MLILEVVTVFLVAVAMALSLAHALEYPGKMRLSKEAYLTTQSIYYPGFTIGGLGEALSLAATLILLVRLPYGSEPFWWTLVAFLSLVAMHGIFWMVTQPVNRRWVTRLSLGGSARRLFAVQPASLPATVEWEQLRDRWEYSHIVRAIFAAIGLISVTAAVALHRRS